MKYVTLSAFCIVLLLSCGNASRKSAKQPTTVNPKLYTYGIVNAYPHSTSSYTQGLQFADGIMWEGTGEYGHSVLQTIDLATGRTDVKIALPDNEFGEGITILGDKIYQLTWQNGVMHVYDRATCRLLYNKTYKGEGWGLTTDGERLYMSDGTSLIRVIDPATFRTERTISVFCNGQSLPYLNELEWIDGRIWANVYTLDQIVIINPDNGMVEGIVDLTGILSEEDTYASTDVLNGIACDEATGRIFVTGKNWSRLFEIKLVER